MKTTTTTTPLGDPASSGQPRLQGRLGVPSIAFMVVAGAAPLTVVGGPMALAFGAGDGAGLPTVYLVTAAVLLLFAAAFTAMTPRVRSAGAFYSYVHTGLGRRAGIGTGYAALLTYVALYVGIYALLGTAIDSLSTSFGGPHVTWWLWSAAALLVISLLGYRNIELSGKVLGVLLVGEVLVVLVMDGVITARGGGSEGLSTGFAHPATVLSGAPGVALVFAVLSFIGVEATAVFRDEAKNPEVTVPRATFLTIGAVGLFYAVTSWALVSAVGDRRIATAAAASPEALLPELSREYLGRAGHDLVSVLFVTSIFAAGLTFHNVVARYLHSLSSRDLLPTRLAAVHANHGSPHRGSVVASALMTVLLALSVLIGLNPIDEVYTWTAGLASVGYVVLLFLTCLSVIVFFRRHRLPTDSLTRTLLAPALSLLGLLGILILMLTNLNLLVGANRAVPVVIVAALAVTYAAGPIVGRLRPGAGREE